MKTQQVATFALVLVAFSVAVVGLLGFGVGYEQEQPGTAFLGLLVALAGWLGFEEILNRGETR